MKDELVPNNVIQAVLDAVAEYEETFPDEYIKLRIFLTREVGKRRQKEGWSFDTSYRHAATPAHALIYALVSTVAANSETDDALDRFMATAYPEFV